MKFYTAVKRGQKPGLFPTFHYPVLFLLGIVDLISLPILWKLDLLHYEFDNLMDMLELILRTLLTLATIVMAGYAMRKTDKVNRQENDNGNDSVKKAMCILRLK